MNKNKLQQTVLDIQKKKGHNPAKGTKPPKEVKEDRQSPTTPGNNSKQKKKPLSSSASETNVRCLLRTCHHKKVAEKTQWEQAAKTESNCSKEARRKELTMQVN